MNLNERKVRILQAIINDYIGTAEPVGSRTISKKYDLGVSSATIRNEMSDLEDLGLLEQPHASAGRIPSDKGYRVYVDQFLETTDLKQDQFAALQQLLHVKVTEIDVLMKQAANLISQMTSYTTMISTPQMSKSKIKHLQLVPIDSFSLLLVLVTHENIVNNKLIRFTDSLQSDMIVQISNKISKKIEGLTLEQIHLPLILEIQKELGVYEAVLPPVLKAISEIIQTIDKQKIFMGGTTKLLQYPEFHDLEKARNILNVFEDDGYMNRVLEMDTEKDLQIVIGKENQDQLLQECSIIKATYMIDEQIVGTIGLIGPTRMEYSKAIAVVESMTKDLSAALLKLIT